MWIHYFRTLLDSGFILVIPKKQETCCAGSLTLTKVPLLPKWDIGKYRIGGLPTHSIEILSQEEEY